MDASARGITLLEMLVALAIALTLLGSALVATRDWHPRHRARAAVDAMAAIVQTSRHAAIHRNLPVVLCPGDANGCRRRNEWHLGTLAFTDVNRNRRIDGRDEIIAQLPPLAHGRFYWRAFRNRGYLRFNASGMTDWQNGHFLYCPGDRQAPLARQIVINYAGRIYYSQDADGDGIHEDADGRPLRCPA